MFFGRCALKEPYLLVPLIGSTTTAVLNFIFLEYVFANSKRRIALGHAAQTDEDPTIVKAYTSVRRHTFPSLRPKIESDAQVISTPMPEVNLNQPMDFWRDVRQRRRLTDVEMGEPEREIQANEPVSCTA